MSAGTPASFDGSVSARWPQFIDKKAIVIPVGLEVGPTWINACFSIVSFEGSEGHYWTGVPCSQVCKDFYQETLVKRVPSQFDFDDYSLSAAPLVPTGQRSAELVEAYARHIEEARNMGASALDDHPLLHFKVMAITVPEHWDVSARTMIAMAARLAGQPLDSSSMILKLPRAVLSAYKMHKDEADRYLTVLVFYHKTHLHLMLVQMSEAGFVLNGQLYLPHLGEDAVLKTSIVISVASPDDRSLNKNFPSENHSREEPQEHPLIETSPTEDVANIEPIPNESFEGLTLEEVAPEELVLKGLTPEPSTSTLPTGDDTASSQDNDDKPRPYRGDLQPILEALQKFLVFMTPSHTPDLTSELLHADRHATGDVAYIVVDGEAHPKGKTALRAAIREAYADMDWLSVKQGYYDCGAVGAKVAAQMQLGNPKHLGDWEDLPGYLPEQDA